MGHRHARRGAVGPRVKQGYLPLHAIIKAVVRQGYLTRDLIDGIEMPRVISRERRFLTAAQVVELAESVPAKYRAFVYVVAYGGLRFSEAVGAPAPPVRPAARPARDRRGRRRRQGQTGLGHAEEPPDRVGQIAEVCRQIVEEHLDQFVDPDPDALVFTADEGGPLRNGNFHARVWKLCWRRRTS